MSIVDCVERWDVKERVHSIGLGNWISFLALGLDPEDAFAMGVLYCNDLTSDILYVFRATRIQPISHQKYWLSRY